jgi:hypothetical protein
MLYFKGTIFWKLWGAVSLTDRPFSFEEVKSSGSQAGASSQSDS